MFSFWNHYQESESTTAKALLWALVAVQHDLHSLTVLGGSGLMGCHFQFQYIIFEGASPYCLAEALPWRFDASPHNATLLFTTITSLQTFTISVSKHLPPF